MKKRNIPISYLMKEGITKLLEAAEQGNIESIKFYLENGMDAETELKSNGMTILHIAADKGYLKLIRYVVEDKSTDINQRDKDNFTALHYIITSKSVKDYITREEIINYLIEKNADINAKDGRGQTPLHYVAMQNNVKFASLLIKSGANIEIRDNYDVTALHRAAIFNCTEILLFLLKNGARINTPNLAGSTPLHWASEKGNKEAAIILCEWGANLEAKDQMELTPLEQAKKQKEEAILNQDDLMQRKFEEFIEKLTLKQKEQEHYSKCFKEASHKEKEELHFITEHMQLITRIKEITREDVISIQIKEIEKNLNQIGSSKNALQIKVKIFELMIEIEPPQNFFEKKINSLRLGQTFKELSEQSLFRIKSNLYSPLIKLITKFEDTIELVKEAYPQLAFHLIQLKDYYENYLEQFNKSSDNTRVKLLKPDYKVVGLGIYRFLTDEASQVLLDNNKESFGTHDVTHLNGIFFKTRKENVLESDEAPGVEFMVDSLNKIIAGFGSPPTMLLKIKDRPYVASRKVEGINLQEILENHHQKTSYLQRLDKTHFSTMVLLSMLTKPIDNKADNYIAQFNIGKHQEIQDVKIIGIDNDLSFGEPIVMQKNGINKGKHFINLKNVLYLFPQMDEKIDEDCRERFIQISPEMVLIDWLNALNKKNIEYSTLCKEGIYSIEEFKSLSLPIHLVPGTVTYLYKTLKQIQDILKNSITHNEIFKQLFPLIEFYYSYVKAKHSKSIYDNCQIKEEYPILETYKSIHSAELFLEDILNDINDEKKKEGFLNQLVNYTDGIEDYKKKRGQTIKEASEELFSIIDFSAMNKDKQVWLLSALGKLSFVSQITIINNSMLEGVNIPNFLEPFSELKKLRLVGCNAVVVKDIIGMLALRPELEITLGTNCKLISAKGWQQIAKKCHKFCLEHQEKKLDISGASPTRLLHDILKEKEDTEEIIEFLLDAGASTDSLNKEGKGALHIAVEQGRLAAFSYLIKRSSSIDQDNNEDLIHFLNIAKKNNNPSMLNKLTELIREDRHEITYNSNLRTSLIGLQRL